MYGVGSFRPFSVVSQVTLFISNFHNMFGTVIVPKQCALTIPLWFLFREAQKPRVSTNNPLKVHNNTSCDVGLKVYTEWIDFCNLQLPQHIVLWRVVLYYLLLWVDSGRLTSLLSYITVPPTKTGKWDIFDSPLVLFYFDHTLICMFVSFVNKELIFFSISVESGLEGSDSKGNDTCPQSTVRIELSGSFS